MDVKFTNNGHSTLAASVATSDTSITVASGHGARFPSLSGSAYFFATLIDASNNLEIVKCTARSSDVLTITRAQESTTARAFAIGDRIELRVTAAGLGAIYSEAVADATPAADSIVNSMIATDAVNADSIAANAVGASELNVSGNGSSGQVLSSDADGTFSWATPSSGKVLQVVQSTGTTNFNTSSASFVATPQTINITPTSSTSTILIQGVNAIWSAGSQYMHLEWRASGGASGVISSWGDWYTGYYGNTPIPAWHTSHSTTSQITYTLYGRSDGGGWYAPNNNNDSDIDNKYMTIAWELQI